MFRYDVILRLYKWEQWSVESTYGILHFVGIICRLKMLDFTAQK